MKPTINCKFSHTFLENEMEMKLSTNLHPCREAQPFWQAALFPTAALLLLSATCLSLSGCGADRPVPQVEPMTFTDGLGNPVTALTEIKAGSGAYLDTVVNNDPALLGVNWSVSCSNEPPLGTPLPPGQPVDMSCGTFTPAHTATAPVLTGATSGAGVVTFYTAPAAVPKDGTVTLYASATADPSQHTTLILTITPQ